MAIVVGGVTGPFVGRIGTTVGYMWKGRNCVRAYRAHINYPDTHSQRAERDWFVGMVRFASMARQVLRLGLKRQAEEARMTEGNYFVMKNKEHFVRRGDGVEVAYERLQLSAGPATDVWFKAPRFEGDETVAVDFEKNGLSFHASGDDRVYLYVYAPGMEQGWLSAPASRRSKSVKIRLPECCDGQEVHLYGFVVDREGRPSNSTYIGVGRVNHYEYHGRYVPLNKNWSDFVDMATELNEEGLHAEPSPTAVGSAAAGGAAPRRDGPPPEVP